MDFKPFLEALKNSVYSRNAKAVAERLGHSVQYLGRICDPDVDPDERKKIQVESLMIIVDETDDDAPLGVLVGMRGYRMVRVDGITADSPTMFQEFYQDHEKLVRFHQAGQLYRAGEIALADLQLARDEAHIDVD